MDNIDKLMQVANYLLKKYDYSLNYTKLIKELAGVLQVILIEIFLMARFLLTYIP